MKRKIAFIAEHASPLVQPGGIDSGGENVYVDKMSRELAFFGYSVDIFTRRDNSSMPTIVNNSAKTRVIHINAGPAAVLPKEHTLQYMDEFAGNVLKFIQKEGIRYDLIHAHYFKSAVVARKLREALGIPYVVTFHALGKVRRIHQGSADGFSDERLAIEEMIAKDADQVIAECPQDREDLVFHYGASPDNITIIPCGFDPDEFYAVDKRRSRRRIGVADDEFVILQLGRMVPRKGVETVIRALPHVAKNAPQKIRLVVVGGESGDPDPQKTPEIARLMDVARESEVLPRVTFVGSRTRDVLKYYYSAADVFVSVPWYEPFGITPLEAMACATPVVGSEVGGIKFTVVHEKTGFLVPAKDPLKLAGKIRLLIENPSLKKRMGKNAQERVHEYFTWKTVATAIASLYERVLAKSRRQLKKTHTPGMLIRRNFTGLIDVITKSEQLLSKPVFDASRLITHSLEHGGKLLLCGNGGSAMDAQHFAVELVGHFIKENRPGIPALSLTSDSSVLTAVGNDFSFDSIFARQVEALGKPGDVLVGISTSGNSENVIAALKEARLRNMITIGLTGKGGGRMNGFCDINIVVPSQSTQHIQELHILVIHTICELVEQVLFPEDVFQPVYGFKHGQSKKHQPKNKGGNHG